MRAHAHTTIAILVSAMLIALSTIACVQSEQVEPQKEDLSQPLQMSAVRSVDFTGTELMNKTDWLPASLQASILDVAGVETLPLMDTSFGEVDLGTDTIIFDSKEIVGDVIEVHYLRRDADERALVVYERVDETTYRRIHGAQPNWRDMYDIIVVNLASSWCRDLRPVGLGLKTVQLTASKTEVYRIALHPVRSQATSCDE